MVDKQWPTKRMLIFSLHYTYTGLSLHLLKRKQHMKKTLATLFLAAVSLGASAQASNSALVVKPIADFFEGMKTSDTTAIRNALAKNAIFQTINRKNEVTSENIASFLESIAKAPKGALDERYEVLSVKTDGNLASVWTSYKFYYNGTFSHCGVNSFQLHKENNDWKIQYVIDTRRKENCE